MATIRHATEDDIDAILAIYNEAVLTTTATFDLEPRSREKQVQWFEAHDKRHPILVAEVEGNVVGWVCLNPWSDRPAYHDTAETSFYVQSTFRGQGIGRQLKQAIIEEAIRLDYYTVIARVAEGSEASLYLNSAFGFEHIGTMRKVGLKFGKRLDVHIFQLMLNTRSVSEE